MWWGNESAEIIKDLSHNKFGLDWMVKIGNDDPIALEEWIPANVDNAKTTGASQQ